MTVFELLGKIVINNKEANKKVTETATKAERAGTRIREAFKNIGSATLRAGKVVGVGAAALGTAVLAGVESTRDYRTEMAKLNTAFVANNFSAEAAKKTYGALQAVLGETDQAVEAASHLAAMVSSEEDLSKWTDICTGVFATFGDSLPIEGLAESANETAKVGTVTGSLADALNWAGGNEEDFNKKLSACTTEEERQALIMNTLYWTYKGASDQYKETAGSVMEANTAQDKLNGALASFWGVLEPIVSDLKTRLAELVTAATPLVEGALQWMIDNGDFVAGAVNLMAGAFAVAAVAAHPYAAAIAAVVAGLAMLKMYNKNVMSGVHLQKYSQEDLDLMQEYVDAVNQAHEAERVLEEDMYNAAAGASLEEAGKRMKALEGQIKAVGGLWEDYHAYNSANGDGNGAVYLDVPAKISDESETDMQGEIDSMSLEGLVKMAADTSGLQAAINATGLSYTVPVYGTAQSSRYGGFTVGGAANDNTIALSHASGLDRVPHDGYLARVHKDEAILNAADASTWRGGGSERVEALLSDLVRIMSAGQTIKLDSGIMAGQLTPAIDAKMGSIAKYKGRGN